MKNHLSCSAVSHPRGMTTDNFPSHSYTQYMSLFSPGRSWLLTNLLYYILEVDNHFWPSIKIKFTAVKKYSHLWHVGLYMHFPEKLLYVLTSQPHFETWEQNSHFHKPSPAVFSAYCSKFSCLSCYPYIWLNTTDLLAITDISVSCPLSKLKLKQDSWFYSHLGHCSLGGISKWLCQCLPWYFSCYF